ncbi:PaaI family thioesterase [Lutimaribacter sp. EGI FJ00015]|uniref:PaaI family thioesterase n=1 Tax=Lutimaribacter degradans TaxID=2945989 RepID=A0ACC5ZVN7_9RHOB|nr:PaaI family thioesterase [Lutimaribacter sp. EGI FJ00013]MCM2562111.1 PaaI family thioesterase [Lutimaribacter sp. EGI FJ00013]MCO0613264.1 PaaI family thioesterase [Lutimaribacter sp. EGI FJ00015]MCO0636241.1 PaaI family thioesterase [Lutimaribacter sp. EGI FJ00014]
MTLKMTVEELGAFMAAEFPQVAADFAIDRLAQMEIDLRLQVEERHLRPGGTVSGPSMFSLADCAIYLAVLAMIGPQGLAVTTNGSIDFMRKPAAGKDIVAKCRLLKLGRVLAVGDVLMVSDGMDQPVARASMTYSIPPG